MIPIPVKAILDCGERLGVTEIARPQGALPSVNRILMYGRRLGNTGLPVLRSQVIVLLPPSNWDCRGYRIGHHFTARGPLHDIRCLALSEAAGIPDFLKDHCAATGATIFASRYDDHLLKSRLTGVLREKGERKIMVHAVLVQVSNCGVLLMGESGIGKTACGLELVAQGAFWIADDAVILERRGESLYGRGHRKTKGLIALRGKGILRAEMLLGTGAVRKETRVDVIIKFVRDSQHGVAAGAVNWSMLDYLDVSLPCYRLVGAGETRQKAREVIDVVKARLLSMGTSILNARQADR